MVAQMCSLGEIKGRQYKQDVGGTLGRGTCITPGAFIVSSPRLESLRPLLLIYSTFLPRQHQTFLDPVDLYISFALRQ